MQHEKNLLWQHFDRSRFMLMLSFWQSMMPIMDSFETNRRPLRRRLFASLLACLIGLQSLILAASPSFASKASHGHFASAIEAGCHAFGGKNAPAQGHREHSGCCVLCRAGVKDLAPLVLSPSPITVARSTPEPASYFSPFIEDDFDKRPIGWTASWSSRAPPRSS